MATIGNSYLNLVDIYKMSDANRNIVPVIEALNTLNPVMKDAVAIEANQGTKHLSTTRTGLPSVTWGKLYQGIPQSKSTTQQVEDTTGFVEGLSTVDERLLELSKNPGAVRMSQAQPFLEAMAQDVQTNFFYSDTATTPERFKGLGARYDTLANRQVVNGGGVGSDNTSIWFVTWGERQTALIYPEGTTAGVSRQDKGEQRVLDSNSNPFFTMEELFTWHIGLTVRDWRYVVRVANIDTSLLAAGSVDIYKYMRQGFWRLRSHRVTGGKLAIYCNSDVLEALDADSTPTTSTSASFVRLKPTEVDGQEVMSYRGIPVRQVDALVNTESRVVDTIGAS